MITNLPLGLGHRVTRRIGIWCVICLALISIPMAHALNLQLRLEPTNSVNGYFDATTGDVDTVVFTTIAPIGTNAITGLVQNDRVLLDAFPQGAGHFQLWYFQGSPAGASIDDPYSLNTALTMGTNNAQLRARFGTDYRVTMSNQPFGAGTTIPAEGQNFRTAGNIPILATASNGWRFVGWTGAGIANPGTNSTTLSVAFDQTVIARYAPNRSITNRLFRGPEGPAFMVTNAPDGANIVLGPDIPTLSSDPNTQYRCIGYVNAFGDIVPPSSTILSVGPFTVTQNSSITWNWIAQYRLRVTTGAGGTVSVDGSDGTSFTLDANQTSYVFADSNTTFNLVASPIQGRVFAGWTGSSNSLDQSITFPLLGSRQYTASFTAADSDYDNDGLPDWWERRWGLSPAIATGNDGPTGDPDGDGLNNAQEFNIASNMCPINYDSDSDGMDDYYETRRVDPTNTVYSGVGAQGFIPAAVNPFNDGAPDANPDGDFHWNTAPGIWGGYELTFLDLITWEEYVGPDNIMPQTNVLVNPLDPLYPVHGQFLQPVRKMFVNPADSFDSSAANRTDTDRDGLLDGFEFDWDQWQQDNSGVLVIYTNTTTLPNNLLIWNNITQTVPTWASVSNRFMNPNSRWFINPANSHYPDYDVWYSQFTGRIPLDDPYVNVLMEQEASVYATATNTLYPVTRLYPPPNCYRWCTNPFMWDTDGDQLPDGYELSFGYDPWVLDSDNDGVTVDGDDNPDEDWKAYISDAVKHSDVYVANGFHPGTGYGYLLSQGAGGPDTTEFKNLDELVGTGSMSLTNIYAARSSHPRKIDSDDDGMWDGWEFYMGFDPTDPLDAGGDDDTDGLSNFQEFQSYATSTNDQNALTAVPDWLNKTLPSDAHDGDTDKDQMSDGGEKAVFNYTGNVVPPPDITIDSNTSAIVYFKFTGGGLNPCTWDTDSDFMPDMWETYYAGAPTAEGGWEGGVNGTANDNAVDLDGDGLLNYQEYLTGASYAWQYQYNDGSFTASATTPEQAYVPGGPYPYDPADFFDEIASGEDNMALGGAKIGYPWDAHYAHTDIYDNQIINTYLTIATPPTPMSSHFSCTHPGQADTDIDGMDDYWEVYHGLNPLFGSIDIVETKGGGLGLAPLYGGAMVPVAVGSTFWPFTQGTYYPFMAGHPNEDVDEDGLPNIFESIQTNSAVPQYYHTDPSPVWMTDISFEGSWVNQYFTLGSLNNNGRWYWDGDVMRLALLGPGYMFDFEMNEGYDTDNDGLSDHVELVDSPVSPGSTDPLSNLSPIRRRALFLNGNAAARIEVNAYHNMTEFKTFTVEAWVRPLNQAVTPVMQTIVERASTIPASLSGGSDLRRNFRLGLTNGIPFIAYDGSEDPIIHVEAFAPTTQRLVADQWYHLAGVYEGSLQDNGAGGTRWVGMLKLYVNGILAAMTPSSEIPANGWLGGLDPINGSIPGYLFAFPITIGASDLSGDPGDGSWIDTSAIMTPTPPLLRGNISLVDYFAGWVDEVHVWDGARNQSQVRASMNRRFDYTTVGEAVADGVWPQLKYCFTFDDLPDPDYSGIVPYAFEQRLGTPSAFTGVNYWASSPYVSTVYTNYQYMPWIENLVAHFALDMPRDARLKSAGSAANPAYPNTCNPYGLVYTTARNYDEQLHPQIKPLLLYFNPISAVYPDMMPLLDAVADEDVPMWDDGSAIQLNVFDTDGDGLSDEWEEMYGLDPLDATGINGADGDLDSDGLSNLYEYLTGNRPTSPDSDGDGIYDIDEDQDGDGLSNVAEMDLMTLPNSKDTDDDGISDWEEVTGEIDPVFDLTRPGTSPDPVTQTDPINALDPLIRRSMYFDGGDRLIVPPANKHMSRSWTLEAWVRPETNTSRQVLLNRFVTGLIPGTTAINYELGLFTNNCPPGELRPFVRYVTLTGNDTRMDGTGSTTHTTVLNRVTIPIGSWSHVAATYNNDSNRLVLYINGQYAAFRNDATEIPPTVYGFTGDHWGDEVTIGANRSAGAVTNGYRGYMDEVRFWSHARTAAEIAEFFNSFEAVAPVIAGNALRIKNGMKYLKTGVDAEILVQPDGQSVHALVKIEDNADARAALAAAGVTLLNPVAPGVWVVSGSRQQLSGLAGVVDSSALLHAGDKISRQIDIYATEEPQTVLVQFHGDVTIGSAVNAVLACGATAQGAGFAGGKFMVVTGEGGNLIRLAARDEVAWIMPAASYMIDGSPFRFIGELNATGSPAPFAVNGNGWEGPGRNRADLAYYFINDTAKLPASQARAAVVAALDKWAVHAALTFTPAGAMGAENSIDFGWYSGDHGDGSPFDGPYNVLAHAYYPNDINPEPIAGDCHFDEDETWSLSTSSGIDLNFVALHELGHSLGIAHSDDPIAVMYPFYSPGTRAELQSDDINAIQELYGDPLGFGRAEYRFDDGGTNAMDFSVEADWNNQWSSAAFLDGAIFVTNTIPPLDKDSDHDGMPDWWEIGYGLDPYDPNGLNGAQGDPDGDGLANIYEYQAGTDPYLVDSNGNGIRDGEEDSDNDGLINIDELTKFHTLMGNLDTDDDGVRDGDEINPNIVKADGRLITSPTYSRSPLVLRSIILDGTPIVVPAVVSNSADRFVLDSWTIEAWVNLRTTNETGSIVRRRTAIGQRSFDLRVDNGRPSIQFSTVNGAVVTAGGTANLPSNTWVHLAGVWNHAASSLEFIINGVSFQAQITMQQPHVGVGATTFGDGIRGYLDDVRIWNSARTVDEIRQSFHYFSSFLTKVSTGNDITYEGVTFANGNLAFADRVIDSSLGRAPEGNLYALPGAAIGPPDFRWYSMGLGDLEFVADGGRFETGYLRLSFTDNEIVASGDPRPEIYVFERGTSPEGVAVFVSEDGDRWLYAGLTAGGVSGIDLDSALLSELVVEYDTVTGERTGWHFSTTAGHPEAITNHYRYIWLVDNNRTAGELSTLGMPGAEIDAVGIAEYEVVRPLAWYPFDDNNTTAEDFANPLNWKYALSGVTFTTNVHAAIYGEQDTEGNGLPDWWEQLFTGSTMDPNVDLDTDELNNWYEYLADTNPSDLDTDNDGILDADEDPDDDDLSNAQEQMINSHPRLPDTDDDGINDGLEFSGGTLTTDAMSPFAERVARLDGTQASFVEMPDSDRFALSNWTVEAWIKPVNVTNMEVIVREVSAGVYNYYLGIDVLKHPFLKFTASDRSGEVMIWNKDEIPANAWTHLAGRYESRTGLLALYVNGIMVRSTYTAYRPAASGFGVVSTRAGRGLDGLIDEIRIWSVHPSVYEYTDMISDYLGPQEGPLGPVSNGDAWNLANDHYRLVYTDGSWMNGDVTNTAVGLSMTNFPLAGEVPWWVPAEDGGVSLANIFQGIVSTNSPFYEFNWSGGTAFVAIASGDVSGNYGAGVNYKIQRRTARDRTLGEINRFLSGGETGLVAYYRFDDRTNTNGTSGVIGWDRGQIQDCVSIFSNNWANYWLDAATLHGSAAPTRRTPGVVEVTSPDPNGTYYPGNMIRVWVTFSEELVVFGTPIIELNTGGLNVYAFYDSLIAPNIMELRFVVGTNDWSWDLDYIASDALRPNGGVIWDLNFAEIDLTLPTPGGYGSLAWNKNILVDPPEPFIGGLPASWLQKFFPLIALGEVNPDDDDDLDGLSNMEEFIAGTDPTDAASVLAIDTIISDATGLQVTWRSVVGHVYRLEYSDDHGGSWNAPATWRNVYAESDVKSWHFDAIAPGTGVRMYRIAVEQEP